MKICGLCDNMRSEWKKEKLNAAIAAAKIQANEQGKTMAIIKEGCKYKTIIAAESAGYSVIQYISKHN